MTLGQRIKQRREELGMSQEELATKLGFKSRSSINKMELDKQYPRQHMLKAIADALNTTVTYSVGVEEEVEQQEQELCDLFSMCYGKESYAAVQKFLKLDSNDRKVVVTMMDSLLSTEKYKEIKSKGDASITA